MQAETLEWSGQQKASLHRENKEKDAMSYIQKLLCSLCSTHAATLSIGYVRTFCFPKINDRRDRRFKPELTPTFPPDGFSVIFSDDTPTTTTTTTTV